ncbi:MAG: hypothetical protein J5803_06010 [Desulfovibrio sp.]|nr:hypothetical protein [Desulfovibrio sp.]
MFIPLNIVKTYPVKWDKYKIFRDFIQNFYDSVPRNKWKKRFNYGYSDGVLEMSVDDISFSYEWLMHIGASTKRNQNGNAGYFGEGFKIASLCALRDYGYSVKMASSTWSLDVGFYSSEIDGQEVEMLGYALEKDLPDAKKTKLLLANVTDSDMNVFRVCLLSFYYPENPILGQVLWESAYGAVSLRSTYPIDPQLPCVSEFGRKGAVFCGYQMLGTNPFDLVVCLHAYDQRDRERKHLYSFDIVDVFKDISRRVSSSCAMVMLEKMRRYWTSYKRKNIDITSWSTVIDILVERVCSSEKSKRAFVEKYPRILCLNKVYGIDALNERRQARDWYRSFCYGEYIFAKGSFSAFGYKTLECFCRENGGFVEECDVNTEIERKCFILLDEFINAVYHDFFVFEEKVEARIIKNETAIFSGMASLTKIKKKFINCSGNTVRYNINYVYLKKSLFEKDAYYKALSVYIHELCHMFGGDASKSFSYALTNAMTLLLHNTDAVEFYHKRWLELFSD